MMSLVFWWSPVLYWSLARCDVTNAYVQAPWEVEDKKPSSEWPAEGNVEFLDYSVRYREGLDLVLRNISLKVKGGEKVRRAISNNLSLLFQCVFSVPALCLGWRKYTNTLASPHPHICFSTFNFVF